MSALGFPSKFTKGFSFPDYQKDGESEAKGKNHGKPKNQKITKLSREASTDI